MNSPRRGKRSREYEAMHMIRKGHARWGERSGCPATDSVHQQAVPGGCMRRKLGRLDHAFSGRFLKVATHPGKVIDVRYGLGSTRSGLLLG